MKLPQETVVSLLVEHWTCEEERFPQGFTRAWAKQKLMLLGQFPTEAAFDSIYTKAVIGIAEVNRGKGPIIR